MKNADRRISLPVRLSDEADKGVCECLWEFGEINGLQAVTAADVQRVARTYFTPENRLVLTVLPSGAGSAGAR